MKKHTPYLLITGPSRSGNHFLHSLLDSHPNLLLSPEEDFFIDFIYRACGHKRLGLLREDPRLLFPKFFINTLLAYNKRDLWNAIINTGRESQHDFSGEIPFSYERYRKSLYSSMPACTFSLPRIAENYLYSLFAAIEDTGENSSSTNRSHVYLCPNVSDNLALLVHDLGFRIIIIIRNPLDRTASLLQSREEHNPQAQIATVKKLSQYFNKLEKLIASPEVKLKLMIVDYDQLKSNTEMVMGKIAAFANIPFSSSMTIPTVRGRDAKPNTSFSNDNKSGEKNSRYAILCDDTKAYIHEYADPQYLKLKEQSII